MHFPNLSVDDALTRMKDKSPKKYKLLNFLWRKVWLQYWFYIGLAIFIVIARFAPNFARSGGLIRGQYSIGYGAVIVIFLGSGLSMKTDELMKNLLNWRAHLTVMILQFLVTSAIIYGFACAVKAANDPSISLWLLAGLIVTGCCPTTVSSNVVMTQKADGNVLLTLCEVFLGNLAGAFVTPALAQMYFTGDWAFANPANGSSVSQVYRQVMKQIGITVFIPLFVGQCIQNAFPKQTKWFLVTFKFNKVGTFMLLLIMFSSFSTAFYQHAFTSVSHKSIIFVCFFNFGIYILFTVICYIMSRPRWLLWFFKTEPSESTSKVYNLSYRLFTPFYHDREETVSILLCGGAKTAALGVTLISAQYGDHNEHLGELLVPLVLYQATQVLAANVFTGWMKRWIHNGPTYQKKLAEKEEKERLEREQKQLNESISSRDDEEDDEAVSTSKVDFKSKQDVASNEAPNNYNNAVVRDRHPFQSV